MRHLKLAPAHEAYIKYLYATRAKSRLTIDKEDKSLGKWSASLGDISLARISLEHLREFAQERAEEGVTGRTINLDVIALGNLLRYCRTDPTARVVTEFWTPLKHTTPRRTLIGSDALPRLVSEALTHKSGRVLADYLLLLAYSGCRKQAGLSARWSRVDWSNRQITFQTKFDKWVTVDMGPQLEAHLRDMAARQTGLSDFLFPSELEGEHWSYPDDIFTDVRKAAGLEEVTFHDFRHAFISRAIMSGVDTLTVARWVGHADGGVLIGKVYGHLNSAHLQASAAKLTAL